MFDRRLISNFNWGLLLLTIVLSLIGLMNLYSATSSYEQSPESSYFQAQLLWSSIGFGLIPIVISIHYRHFKGLSIFFYIVCMALLLMVLAMGKQVSGHQSWLQLGPVHLQPTELAKIAFILILAQHFSQSDSRQRAGIRELVPSMLLFIVPMGLVVLQGDLGSSLFFVLIYMSLALLRGVQIKIWLGLASFAVVAVVVVYLFLLSPYQKGRINNFLNPEEDRKGSGYHLIQSKIAVGSGWWGGKGYMKGQIHKLKFVPERHTDFIFPVLAEEWGFFGGMTVLSLFGLFLFLAIQVAYRTIDRFGYYLSMGIAALFFWHFVINLGGVLGLMPLTGVPLPFLSYGGSSLITSYLAIGLLLNVHMRRFMFT